MIKRTILGTALALGISTVGFVQLADQPFKTVEASEIEQQIQKSSLQERLDMLELSVLPTSSEEAIANFAKAVKLRNGALQYALLSENEKAKVTKKFEENHWVTGGSSPWVETYQVVSEKELKAGTKMEYVVEFHLFTSTGKAGTDQARLTVEKNGNNWFITNIEPTSKKSVGIWKTYDEMNVMDLEEQLKSMETYNSSNGYSFLLPSEMMKKLTIKEGTCENEEGKPACTSFYYKDEKQKQDIFLFSLMYLTKQQAKSAYYQDHPFLKFAMNNDKKGTFYIVETSEHPYGDAENTAEGKEWSYLYHSLGERLKTLVPTSN
ncbi:hypothetical protein SAMN05880501_11446 [Ureibacillus xyleni]|uniref:DUF4878 domain-containing protein n=1 Tax=Ureibacillus xyleni TaxID=614648 RepID=A0A285TNX1_9BACL|nr:hypothetical protein [Ureibacillus xyleni]SOC22547.1 hypothetical protein SAMN05880501_11446 [Ureibacillus xyleni]